MFVIIFLVSPLNNPAASIIPALLAVEDDAAVVLQYNQRNRLL